MQKTVNRIFITGLCLFSLLCGCPDPGDLSGIKLSLSNTPAAHTFERNIRISVTGSGAVTYKYKLDDNAFSAEKNLSEEIVESNLALGLHTLCVIGKNAGNTWQTEAEGCLFNWNIDADPAGQPQAELGSLPAQETNIAAVSINVSGNIVSYKFKLDEGVYGNELSTDTAIVLDNIPEGQHMLSVIGKNKYGEWQTSATVFVWTVDLSAPTAVLINLPFQLTSCNWIDISVSDTECIQYRYKLDNQPLSAIHSVQEPIQYSALTEGSHQLAVIGQDRAGNWQSEADATLFSWELDLSGTLVNLDALPSAYSNKTNIDITVGGADFTAYKYRLKSKAWSEEIAIGVHITESELSEGENCLYVVGRTVSGDWQTERVFQWLIDLTPPSIGPISDVPWTKAPVTIEANVSDTLECTYLWEVIQGTGVCVILNSTTSGATLEGGAGEEHKFIIRFSATDQAGNITKRQFIFNWDSKAPTVDAGANLGWWGTPGRPVPVVTDLSPLTYYWEKTSGTGSIVFSNNSQENPLIAGPENVEGTYTLKLTVTDSTGNQASDTLQLSWDSIAPAPVTGLTRTTYAFQSAFAWQNPVADITGVLMIRNTADPLTAIINGTVYTQNQLSGGDTLVYSGTAANFTDLNLLPDTEYHYAVYVYDKAYNYSQVYAYQITTTIPVVFVRSNGNNLNSGFIPTAPMQSINTAINALADREYKGEVRVAAGSYTENIIMRAGVSILGGFNNNWTARDKIQRKNALYSTTLSPDLQQPVISCDDLGSDTVIEGFVIDQPRENAVISNRNASPVIAYNTITGGYGICNRSNSSPLIKNNIIIAGPGSISFAICNEESSSPYIYSNIIHGGFGTKNSFGVYNKDNSTPVIRNNTISGGCPTGTAYGIYIHRSPGLIIENNIIFVSGGSIQYCIYEYYFDNPLVLRNNLLTGAAYLYHDDNLGELNNITDINEQIGVETGRSNIARTSPGFIQPEQYTDPLKQDWQEMQEEGFDWHLTSNSGIDIKAGGADLSLYISDDVEGNARTNTYSSEGFVDPTMPGAGGWSLGAYEFD